MTANYNLLISELVIDCVKWAPEYTESLPSEAQQREYCIQITTVNEFYRSVHSVDSTRPLWSLMFNNDHYSNDRYLSNI